MTKFNLYITDWNPNGTNDLLICDEDHQIIDAVQECTFGIDVRRGLSDDSYVTVANDTEVFSMRNDLNRVSAESTGDVVAVKQVTLDSLKKFVACSPLDPDGSTKLSQVESIIGRIK